MSQADHRFRKFEVWAFRDGQVSYERLINLYDLCWQTLQVGQTAITGTEVIDSKADTCISKTSACVARWPI